MSNSYNGIRATLLSNLSLLFGGVCFSQGIKDPRSEELKILPMKLSKKPKRLKRDEVREDQGLREGERICREQ